MSDDGRAVAPEDAKGFTSALGDYMDEVQSNKNSNDKIDTVTYEGLYGKGEYVIKNGTDTIKQRPSGGETYYDYNDRTGN